MGIVLLLALILGQQAAPSPNGVREVDEGITRDITGSHSRDTPLQNLQGSRLPSDRPRLVSIGKSLA
jgi:hypothetical protein